MQKRPYGTRFSASDATWADSREGDTPSVTSLQPSRIVKALETAREAGAALAIIDTAPRSADAAMLCRRRR
jgi:hypothetical protein